MNILNPKYSSLEGFKQEFLTAKPYPFIVLDDFLDPAYFDEMTKVLSTDEPAVMGASFETDVEFNKSISLNANLPSMISNIVDELNKQSWVENLKQFTGIDTLVATQNGNTLLANYHEMTQGGLLGSHVDHSYEPKLEIPHVLNIVLYLSSDWKTSFGGATLLFDKNGRKPMAKVEYKPNRAIVFLHTPYSFHGVEKIHGNGSIPRKTLYVDYYSESFEPFKHLKLDFPNVWFKHATTFILPRFLDLFKPKNKAYRSHYFQYYRERFKKG